MFFLFTTANSKSAGFQDKRKVSSKYSFILMPWIRSFPSLNNEMFFRLTKMCIFVDSLHLVPVLRSNGLKLPVEVVLSPETEATQVVWSCVFER